MTYGRIEDTGDAVGSGDTGSFGRPSFGDGPGRGVDIVNHHPDPDDIALGATPLPEDELVEAVLTRLAAEGIDAGRIRVEREARDITLHGEVADDDEVRISESVARGTPGVAKVMNELHVAP